MMSSLPPFLIFYIGGLLVAVTGGKLRSAILVAIPLLGAYNLWTLDASSTYELSLFDYELALLRVDKLSILFGYLFHLAALIGIVFSLHVNDRMQDVSGVIYAGSAIGAVFAGDLISLFIFWEMMAISSMFLILARRTERSANAAMRYLLVQVASGVILLAGVMVRIHETGSIAFDFIGLGTLSGALILIAFGIKSAFPFMHSWLTDAYPEATATGAVFLSAFSTKTAVYALARAYPGTDLLIYVGAAMAMFPIFYAVIENDLRRVLAYSLINQVGYMVCGIGIGTALAINGVVSHAFSHVIYKGLLFMSMGAVLYRVGRIGGDGLGGLYKTMPWTAGFCIIGAASISAFPLFSGFISKSMVMAAALEEHQNIVWLCLLFASAGVFHHAGIKIPYFAFFAHDSGLRPKEAPLNMLIAMGIGAFVCVFIGCYPWLLYSMLPHPVEYSPYTADHVLTQCQLLFFSALAFCLLKLSGLYPPELPSTHVDVDWTYRKLLPCFGRWVNGWYRLFVDHSLEKSKRWLESTLSALHHYHGPAGIFARTWPTGSMAFWTTLLLGAYLLVYYL